MYIKRFIPLFHLILWVIFVGSARAKMIASMTKIECPIYAPDLIRNASCHVNQTTRGTGTFSAKFYLTEGIKVATGKFIVSLKQGSSITNYLSTKMDYCKLLAGLRSNYLLKTIAMELRRVSNLPLECPFEVNKLYYIKDFTIDTIVLPRFVPELGFISDVQINYKKRRIAQLIIYGSIAPD